MIGAAGIQSYLKQVAGKLRGAFGPSKDDVAAVRRNGEWEEWNPRIALGQRLWLAAAIGANPHQATLGPWGRAIDQVLVVGRPYHAQCSPRRRQLCRHFPFQIVNPDTSSAGDRQGEPGSVGRKRGSADPASRYRKEGLRLSSSVDPYQGGRALKSVVLPPRKTAVPFRAKSSWPPPKELVATSSRRVTGAPL